MSECADLTYYQKNGDVILNRAKYRNLSEEEKNKKREYGKIYHNTSEEKKKFKKYQKNYREAKKSKYNNE